MLSNGFNPLSDCNRLKRGAITKRVRSYLFKAIGQFNRFEGATTPKCLRLNRFKAFR